MGGLFASLGYTIEFLGELILFGGLLGIGQALVLLPVRPFRNTLAWAGSWFSFSFSSWIIGSITTAFVPYDYSPVPITVLDILYWATPWFFLALGQGVILAAYSRRPGRVGTFRRFMVILSGWLVVGSVGGFLATAVIYLHIDPFREVLGESFGFGDLGYEVFRYTVLISTVYGVPTGIVLTWSKQEP